MDNVCRSCAWRPERIGEFDVTGFRDVERPKSTAIVGGNLPEPSAKAMPAAEADEFRDAKDIADQAMEMEDPSLLKLVASSPNDWCHARPASWIPFEVVDPSHPPFAGLFRMDWHLERQCDEP